MIICNIRLHYSAPAYMYVYCRSVCGELRWLYTLLLDDFDNLKSL